MRSNLRFLIILFLAPLLTSAQVYFSEIMYDPEGSDASSGGEWFEVINTGPASVDFTKFIFFENETNHSITAVGDSVIPSGGYAVVSKDPTVFKNYFTNFSGLLFKSSFSLNDGEKLAIKKNKDDVVTSDNSMTYTADWGAKNDGNSLQKDSSGSWIPSAPTPGSGIISRDTTNATNESSVEGQATVSTTENLVSNFPVEPRMIVDAGANKTAVVGSLITFDGIALGLKKEPIENARYLWSFGDGSFKEGRSVVHTYRYPGEYIVVLEVSSGYFSGSDRVKVLAVAPEIIISKIGDALDYFIEVTNNSKHELDLSGWILRSQNAQFFIPKNTIIMSGGKVSFSSTVTGFSFNSGDKPSLLYPSGATATTYGESPSKHALQKDNGSIYNIDDTSVVKNVSVDRQQEKTALAASILAVDKNDTNFSSEQNQTFPLKWLLAVGVLSAVAIGGVMLNGISVAKKPDELSADDFEIEEDVG